MEKSCRISSGVLAAAALMLSPSLHAVEEKPLPPPVVYDWEYIIVPSKDSPKSAVGYVEIFPQTHPAELAKFAVLDGNGVEVACKKLWESPGEPVKILFDNSSASRKYRVVASTRIPEKNTLWEPKAGLVMETRKRAQGSLDNWDNARKTMAASSPVEGRSLVNHIFHGINPHGPSSDIVVHYKGYLDIKEPGEYEFAVAADDAVFLLINGAKVAEWPGTHGPWEGVRGKFSGKTRLSKGIHRLEYYNIQVGEGLCMACGWHPPGKKHIELLPPEAFVPAARFENTQVLSKGRPLPAFLTWRPRSHLTAAGIFAVDMQFNALTSDTNDNVKWFFDDTSTATGKSADNLFLSTGIREVRMELTRPGNDKTFTLTNKVNVHPNWSQREEWPKNSEKHLENAAKSKDIAAMPIGDALNLAAILDDIERRDLLANVAETCLKRKSDFKAHPEFFFMLSQCLIHHSVRRYQAAEEAYRCAIEFSRGSNPEIEARAQLYLAALLIHNFGKFDQGIELIAEIDQTKLPPFDKRKLMIWKADAYMTTGDMPKVEEIYRELPKVVDVTDQLTSVRNEARVFNAQEFLRRGELEEAEKAVWHIEWEFPYEAMKSHTGMLMTKIFIARKEYNYALWRCIRMMNAAQNSRQMSDIMLALVEIYELTGAEKEAQSLADKLLKEYPYSEAAAILKHRRRQ
ncbi:MAG: hypothetical protein JW808_08565 [Victivallales bacterium]|nr:hypothetical protein [Victivallales bacterium]